MQSNNGTLKSPVGSSPEQNVTDIKECLELAKKSRDVPLSREDQVRLDGIETARFFEGGRGRDGFSDQYGLCFIKRGYRWSPK